MKEVFLYKMGELRMDYKKIIQSMTLEEKASLCSGRDFWHTKAVDSQNVPEILVSDGPNGLRKQPAENDVTGRFESIKAVCFPAACAQAASFDRDLLYRMGKALGVECQAEDISTLLGPAVNIKRTPLCGRNFEYFSEDPYVSTELAGAYIKGVQSKNIGVSIKHFLVNNQETRRFTVSADVDERALREIYLASFEGAIKEAKPWTVMCSLNRVNEVFASENKEFLTTVLRDEWGYDGVVMSDWSAVNNRVKALDAGLDLEMPGSYGVADREIVAAVQNGVLSMDTLDKTVERILKWVDKYVSNKQTGVEWDKDADHEFAGVIAEECAVLLKNDANILPLSEDARIAVVGRFATQPRYQGGGSANVNTYKVTSFMDVAEEKGREFLYADGYDLDSEDVNHELITKAVDIAAQSDITLIFAGLPDLFESEGYDREHMRLPQNQNVLIEEILKVQTNVVVVLNNGSPVEMPWADKVKGILEMYLGGQNVGTAEYRILFGKANPSGKLPESFPLKLSDNPSYLFYPGDRSNVRYSEGVFVGYRYYDTKQMEVLFPFGHGLSYTNYAYSNLKLSKESMLDTDTLTVSVDVTNSGGMDGKEVVQLYVKAPETGISRPVHELRRFEKVALKAGETKTVTFELGKRAFAYWNCDLHDWYVASGEYIIEIGSSSRDIRCAEAVSVESTVKENITIDENTCFGDLLKCPELREGLSPLVASLYHRDEEEADFKDFLNNPSLQNELEFSPLRTVMSFGDGRFDREMFREAIAKLNEKNIY